MRKSVVTALLGALLVGCLATAALLVAVNYSANGHRDYRAAADLSTQATESDATEADHDDADEPDQKGEKAKPDSRGFGPPPWAHAHGHQKGAKGHGVDAAWKDAWRALTPAQRERKMAEFAKSHAEGMKKWADCVAAAGSDSAKRAACAKPLPPGQAKHRL